MAQCDKCRKFLPPGFISDVHPKSGEYLKGNLCTFCATGEDIIKYGNGKQITKDELVREYQIFMRKVVENNDILKEGAKGMPIKGLDKLL